ncbi:FG-GAP repeat domain-containing protein [Nannocystis radixulma]|uniref:VCBS repeat-containing protein n=1 Tax=Nannocystis radixulma TaxID=2995305 RepID=A0ABT5BFH7_9BACT|nr:VCBS repeat-containing protein [Nannocystis radixulma]MDC0672900.1 VCBS repeat-containing protein [Nannocystis radixulma]
MVVNFSACCEAQPLPDVTHAPPSAAVGTADAPQPGQERPTPSDQAPPEASARWFARAFAQRNHYSQAAAVQRHAALPNAVCPAYSVWLANGNDHIPQYTSRFETFGSKLDDQPLCLLGESVVGLSTQAMHFADVTTANLDSDPEDEVLLAALAGRNGCADTGGVWVLRGDRGNWDDAIEIGGGYAAASVAVGDVDRDGRLDTVVGTLGVPDAVARIEVKCKPEPFVSQTRGKRTVSAERSTYMGILGFPFRPEDDADDASPGQCMLPIQLPYDNAPESPVLVYRGGASASTPPLALPASGAVDVELHDVDRDGALDIVVAGLDVRIYFGPLNASSVDCAQLTLVEDDPGGLAALDVAVADVDAGTGDKFAWIAAAQACLSLDGCEQTEDRMGVHVWRSSLSREFAHRLLPVRGMPSAVHFTALDEEALPDLLVGRMMDGEPAPACSCNPAVLGERLRAPKLGYIGAPLLAFPGRSGGDQGPWPAERPTTIHLVGRPGAEHPEMFPMISRIIEVADDREWAYDCAGQGSDGRHCKYEHAAPAGSTLVYRGPGSLASVASVTGPGGRAIPFHHRAGDSFITLARESAGPITVGWRAAKKGDYVVTSTSPLPDPTGASLFITAEKLGKSSGEGVTK